MWKPPDQIKCYQTGEVYHNFFNNNNISELITENVTHLTGQDGTDMKACASF